MFDRVVQICEHMVAIYSGQLPMILGFAALFTIVAMFHGLASTPGKYWWRNPGLSTDATYLLIHSLIGSYFRIPIMLVVTFVLSRTMSEAEILDYFTNGRGPFSGMPFWWQFAIYLVVSDFLLYWIHRLFHRGSMWRFHAIHHSATQVDWTTSMRFHPVNLMLQSSLVLGLMISLGIKPEVIALAAPIDAAIAVWQHSNTKMTLGPLKYVIATPVFHRWHHTMPEEGGNSNFAPTFAFWDLAFGTFYMPQGKLPENFGADDAELGEGYVAQFVYPFRAYLRDAEASAQAPATDPPAS